MHKLIFIEGLPGSGKTTFVKRLEKHLNKTKEIAKSFKEGDLIPIDLAWIAILNETEYKMILDKYPHLKEQIIKYTRKVKDKYYFAYINVAITEKDKSFHKTLEQFEIYQTNDLNHFLNEHIKLWQTFAKEIEGSKKIYLFESVFLQNHMNEILLNQGFDTDKIMAYYNKLTKSIIKLKPLLIYIKQQQIGKTLKRISDSRLSSNKELYNDWIDNVIEHIELKPMAKKRNYLGYKGVINYFKDRQSIELETIKGLNMDYLIIPLADDYEKVFKEMIDYLAINL